MRRIAVALVAALMAPTVVSAEHWCERLKRTNKNVTLHTICQTPSVLALDKKIIAVFERPQSELPGKRLDDFRKMQFEVWLPFRDGCKRDIACLERRYQFRIAEITGARLGTPEARANVDVLPNGWIRHKQPDGSFSYYNPAKDCQGKRQGGRITCVGLPGIAVHSNVDKLIPPTIGQQNMSWVSNVNKSTLKIMGHLIDDDAVQFLRQHAPQQEVKKVSYYLNALIDIRGY